MSISNSIREEVQHWRAGASEPGAPPDCSFWVDRYVDAAA